MKYIVEGPDGKRYVVEGPATGPQDSPAPQVPPQVQAAPAAASQGLPEGAQMPPRAGGYGPVMAGIADAGIKGYLGVKGLFGGNSPEDQAILREQKAEAEADPNKYQRLAGEIGGNIAATALPGSWATRGLSGTRAAMAAGRATPVLAAGAVSGGQEFLTMPSEEEGFGNQLLSRGKNAAQAAATGAIFTGTLGAMAKPFRSKPEADKLFSQGVNPTLAQGAAGTPGRFIGGLTSGITDVRERQKGEVADALMRRVTEGNVEVPGGTGRDYVDAAKGYLAGAYDDVVGKRKFPISPQTRSDVAEAASHINGTGQFTQDAQRASRAVGNIMGDAETTTRVGSRNFRDNYLTPMARAAHANGVSDQTRQRILAAREVLIQKSRSIKLTPEEQARLKQLDTLEFDLGRMREAAQGAASEDVGLNPNALARAYGSRSDEAARVGNTTEQELIGPARRVLGSMPRQDESRTAFQIARRMAAPVLKGAAGAGIGAMAPSLAGPLAAGYGLSALGQSKVGSKALLGQYEAQKRLAELLRQYGGASGIGAAVNTEE